MTKITRRSAVASGLALAATRALPARAADMEIRFYYPIAVSGPITKLIDGYGADFEKENPGVKIKPIYAGDYVQTIGKALIAVKGGDIPECAILLAADIITLTDEDAVIALDDLAKTPQDKAWLDGFYPAFMENARLKGKTYAVPFQRSTPVLYWNKAAFQEAGLDPDKGPADWDEMLAFAKKLTKKDGSGNVTQWGLEIPSDGNTSWLFSGLTAANGVRLMNPDGNKTDFDDPRVVEALRFFLDLSKTYGVQPSGLTSWGAAPRDFLEKKLAMIWQTTGNLTNIRQNASFPFGVAMLPKKVRYGAPTGGGNFYIFKGISPEKQAMAFRFVKFMTTPERAAAWSIATGYVATSPAAYATDAMKKYIADFPQAAVARDQLQYAGPEITVHEGQRVMKVFNDNLQAALTGGKTPEAAMKDAQREADHILKDYG
ncbi:MAG: ABC transporter substrate-binding protein [Hyphomicrobiales bacterium]|nr:ABC transporter substrate-binding protein [Hyphomicrobiales bacterium]